MSEQLAAAYDDWIKEAKRAKIVVEDATLWSDISHERKMKIYHKLKQLHDDCQFDDEVPMADNYKKNKDLKWKNFDSVWKKVLAEEDKKQFLAQFNDNNDDNETKRQRDRSRDRNEGKKKKKNKKKKKIRSKNDDNHNHNDHQVCSAFIHVLQFLVVVLLSFIECQTRDLRGTFMYGGDGLHSFLFVDET